jgi:hypothetical protein
MWESRRLMNRPTDAAGIRNHPFGASSGRAQSQIGVGYPSDVGGEARSSHIGIEPHLIASGRIVFVMADLLYRDRYQADGSQFLGNRSCARPVVMKVPHLVLMGSKRDHDDARHQVAVLRQFLSNTIRGFLLPVRTDVDVDLCVRSPVRITRKGNSVTICSLPTTLAAGNEKQRGGAVIERPIKAEMTKRSRARERGFVKLITEQMDGDVDQYTPTKGSAEMSFFFPLLRDCSGVIQISNAPLRNALSAVGR